MNPKLAETALIVRGRPLSWAEILLAAAHRGELDPLLGALAEGLAARAELDRSSLELDAEELQREAGRVRAERQGRGRADIDTWLGSWGISFEDFTEHTARRLLRRLLAERLPALVAELPPDEAELRAALWPECVLTGATFRWGHALATRVLLAPEPPPAPPPEGEPERHARALARRFALPEAPLPALFALEASFAGALDRVAPRPRAVVELRRFGADWARLTLERVTLKSRDEAEELALCVREDGLEVPAAAALAGALFREETRTLQSLAGPALAGPTLAGRALELLRGARAGELVGPLAVAGGYEVIHVRARREADPDDAGLVDEVRRDLLGREVRRGLDEELRWLRELP